MWLVGLAIVAIVGLSVYAIGYRTAPLTIGGTTTTASTSSGSCPSTGLTSIMTSSNYLNGLKQITPATTEVMVYTQGSTTPLKSKTISGSVNASVNVNCGANVYLVYGGDGTYYNSTLPLSGYTNVGQSAQFSLPDSNMQLMTLPSTYSIFNGTAYTSTYANVPATPGMSNGASKTFPVTITAGSGVYGNGEIEVLLAYNSTEFSSVTLSQYNGGPVPQSTSVVMTPTMAGRVQTAFTTEAYTIPSIQWSNSTTFNLNFQAGTLNTNTVVANPIQMMLKDSDTFILNGVPLFNQFVNPVTKASIGLSATGTLPLTVATYNGVAAAAVANVIVTVYK